VLIPTNCHTNSRKSPSAIILRISACVAVSVARMFAWWLGLVIGIFARVCLMQSEILHALMDRVEISTPSSSLHTGKFFLFKNCLVLLVLVVEF
jgi:hypothetical protein